MGKTSKLTQEVFEKRAKEIHNNEYDYSKAIYINLNTKVIIICPIHGEFKQTPKNHLNNKTRCPSCFGGIRSNLKDFIKKSKNIWGDLYDYSKVNYINSNTPVKIICPIHGEFKQTPNRHLNKKRKIGCNKCAISSNITTETFIENVKHLYDKYDYSKVSYINNKTKIKLICPIHGEFEQTPNSILSKKYKELCPKCSGKDISTEDFIKKSNIIHNNVYDYSLVEYVHSKSKVSIICPIHGKFEQIPNSHLSGSGCNKCASIIRLDGIKNISKWEIELSDYINRRSVNDKFVINNDRFILNGQELDIYIPDKNIAIECNGNYWHTENNGKDKNYHLNKTIECEKKGIQLLHIFESEYLFKPDIVKSLINSKLGACKKMYARMCKIKEIDAYNKNIFLNRTHLQGEDKSSIKLGLFFEDNLVSVMTFCKSRFNKNYEWELSRFSSELNLTVIGGASKLLNYFIKTYKPSSIITYADRRHSNGNLYKQLGFTFSHYSKPNYFYVKNDNNYELLSRQQFQKHKLKNKLELFNSDLSEWENMKLNGYDRIWDCGNLVWCLIKTF